MKCKKCGADVQCLVNKKGELTIVEETGIACAYCWVSPSPSDLDKLKAVLDEIGANYKKYSREDYTIISWDDSSDMGDTTYIYMKFDKEGKFVK